jgi:excisionase family DNA binding protein
MTTKSVMLMLNITKTALYGLVARGELPAIKVGREHRFRPDDVAAFMTPKARS